MEIYWDGEDRWYAAEVRRRKRLPEAGADRWQPGGALVHELTRTGTRTLSLSRSRSLSLTLTLSLSLSPSLPLTLT